MHNNVVVIEHEVGAGPGYLGGWLAAAGVDCEIVRPYLGDPVPGRVRGGLIVLGGEPSAWDDESHPWLPATRELIRAAVRDEVPTLGICLGGQLMTLACGGVVERGERGLEVGVRPVLPLPAAAGDPLFGPVADAVGSDAVAVQYHRDAMTRLPAGAVPLMTGDLYANQAYRLGSRAWAVQFHPEATPEIFIGWTAGSADALTDAGHCVEDLNHEAKRAEQRLIDGWRPLAAGFAAVVAGKAGT
jgi:GMP synthase (glutamine-hydrolysing)